VRARVADGVILHGGAAIAGAAFGAREVRRDKRPAERARERQTLMSGGPLTKLLDSDPSKEVAVFGAVWIDATPALYVRRVKDIENFERGGAFRITKRISDPSVLEDFAKLELPAEDVKDLRSCKVGDCEIKIGLQVAARAEGRRSLGHTGREGRGGSRVSSTSVGVCHCVSQGRQQGARGIPRPTASAASWGG